MTPRHASALDTLFLGDDFDGEVFSSEPLAKHTSYQIGGPAQYYVQVHSVGALSKLLRACEETSTPWFVLGRGSNVLVSDKGFPGVIITLGRDFKICRFDAETNTLCCGAGVALATAVQEAFRRSLAGLEFAVGTPGTLGGALRMNAGSKDTWIGSIVSGVTTYRSSAGIRTKSAHDLSWGYRSSSFLPDEIILECQLALAPSDPFLVRGKMEDLLSSRRKKQPLALPSCGSVFRNPEGESAGALIEQAGMKGFRIGGAEVSELHANFIVNIGNATSADVQDVMHAVREGVLRQRGIMLEPEVILLGQ